MLRVGRFSLAALVGVLALPLASTASHAYETVVIKLQDELFVMADGSELVSIDAGVDVGSINDVLTSFTATDVVPLIGLDPVALRAMRETAMLNLGRPVADLTQFFRVSVDADADDLVDALLLEDLVEGAYVDSSEYHVQGDI